LLEKNLGTFGEGSDEHVRNGGCRGHRIEAPSPGQPTCLTPEGGRVHLVNTVVHKSTTQPAFSRQSAEFVRRPDCLNGIRAPIVQRITQEFNSAIANTHRTDLPEIARAYDDDGSVLQRATQLSGKITVS
jgi:hypothetical protein